MQRVAHCICRSKVKIWNTFLRTISTNALQISEEVREAVHAGRPVVALESTIITHGMPNPDNLSTAMSVEDIIRDHGVIPATVGILEGKLKVGLTRSEITFLSKPDISAVKTSRRDLPVVLSKGLNGGTTVSGTMVAAHLAGIPIFVTGGIGGVHRGVEETLDISADLTELGRTPVTVVSAGVKSILDIGRTLEYLETQGVCVTSFGPCQDFPAFFVPSSGYKAPYSVSDAEEAAALIDSHSQLGLQSGIVIGVPIPEDHAATGTMIESAIKTAVQEAREKRVSGKEVTPYILQRVNEITGGLSLRANIALIQNNAAIGSQIAKKLSRKRGEKESGTRNGKGIYNRGRQTSSGSHSVSQDGHEKRRKPADVVVVGGSIVDFYARIHTDQVEKNGATYPGSVNQSFGGVGRNLADCMTRLDVNTLFISAVGRDSHTDSFQTHCKHMDLSGVAVLEDHRTATYCAVLQKQGELAFGIGDMDIHQQVSPLYIENFEEDISRSKLVCIDGNITPEAIGRVCKMCRTHDVPVWYEPTDIHKATQPFQVGVEDHIWLMSPNLQELCAMYKYMSKETKVTDITELSIEEVIEQCVQMTKLVITKIPVVMVTLGKHGVLLCQRTLSEVTVSDDGNNMTVDWFPATVQGRELREIVSVSGAGDCLAATMMFGIVRGQDLHCSLKRGLMAAQLSLQSHHAVPNTISQANVAWKEEYEGLYQTRRIC